jgi:hypothetical protein
MRKDGVRAAQEATREEVAYGPLCAREGVRQAQEAIGKDGVRAAQEVAHKEVVFSPLCTREGVREA